MSIYEKPTKTLLKEWARDHLKANQVFPKNQPIEWFKENYPRIKSNTVDMHVEQMAVNNTERRRHYPNVKPGSGHDLFWKVAPGQFRLWDSATDPAPRYKTDIEAGGVSQMHDDDAVATENDIAEADAFFAYEKDLQNYLARNLHVLEPGLVLYEEDGISGLEYNVGGRYIDILAIDREGDFVVIELKVSRGYERVIGQLLRYMGWVEQNLSDGRVVRGIIVANEITQDLVFATKKLPFVKLFEYEISFSVKPVINPLPSL